MDINEVPQDNNRTLGGHRKAVYARDDSGRMVLVPTTGWEAEEIATAQAIDAIQALADAARERAMQGLSSPLEYWMYARRMDLDLLAQATGLWRWRIRRHLRQSVFARLSSAMLRRYAEALGISTDQLRQLP